MNSNILDDSAAAAKIAREALDGRNDSESAKKWRSLFGDKFPVMDDDDTDGEEKNENIDILNPLLLVLNLPNPGAIDKC